MEDLITIKHLIENPYVRSVHEGSSENADGVVKYNIETIMELDNGTIELHHVKSIKKQKALKRSLEIIKSAQK